MKVSLILEAQDRASKAVQALQKSVAGFNTTTVKGAAQASLGYQQTAKAIGQTTKATEQAAKATQGLAKGGQQVSRAQAQAAIATARTAAAIDQAALATRRAARADAERARQQAAVERRMRAIVRLGERQGRVLGRGFQGMGAGAAQMGQGVVRGGKVAAGLATGGGMLGLSAGIVSSQLVKPAAEFEKFQTVLETLEGSAEAARKSMAWVSDFAAKTPYDVAGVTEAFVQMRSYGLNPVNGSLRTLGDAAAAMNKPLMQAVEALADAVTGENERLKELGIKASKEGKYFEYSFTGKDGRQKSLKALANNRAAIEKAILHIFRTKYDGSMDRLSLTWDGMISNLGDQWTRIQLAIMNAGLFDWMKGKLADVLALVDRMAADGSLQRWAREIAGTLRRGMEVGWEFAKGLGAAFVTVGAYAERAAAWMGGWENLAYALIALPFLPALLGIAAGFMQLAGGMMVAGIALVKIIGLMRAAGMFARLGAVLTGLGSVFRLLVAPIGLAARAFVALGAAMMTTPLGWIVAGIAAIAAGAYLIYDNWDRIGPWFAEKWATVKQAFTDAWDAISGFDWSSLVPSIDWGSWIPKLSWGTLLPTIDWAAFIPSIDWRSWFSFSWRDVLPAWSWSDIIPSMPDFGSWFGSGTAAASKLTEALPSDPASLERAAAATAGIKANVAGLATLDTSRALAGVNAVGEAAAKAVADVKGLPPAAATASSAAKSALATTSFHAEGVALMSTLAAGIRAGAGQAVAAVRGVAQQMRDHLPHSPAKVGPLSDLHRVRFSETLAAAIRPGPAVAAARSVAAGMMAAVAAPLAAPALAATGAPLSAGLNSMPAAGGVTLNYSPTLTVHGGGPDAQASFTQQLREHADLIAGMVDEAVRRRERRSY